MIKSFAQAVKFIEQYIPTPDKKHPGELGLRRMQYLMDLLDNPQLKYPTIHVGGTSGKGSTSTIIASILATKYKVGLHTSPHLVRITERMKIFSRGPLAISARGPLIREDIPDKEFIALLNKVIPFINKVEESSYGKPSYFEIVAAMAFLHFYQQKVDIAVIEVGMGGKFDATNVIKPLVAVLTNVSLDHTEILGDTVEKIAEDKAGIIKSGIKVVSGVKKRSVVSIIKATGNRQKAVVSLLKRDFGYKIKSMGDEGSVFDYFGSSGSDLECVKGLTLSLLGEFQVENAAVAIRTVEVSRAPLASSARGALIIEKDIRLGLLNTFIPGRLEIISRNPLVILDGAHNPDKVGALVNSIKKIFPKSTKGRSSFGRKRIITIVAIKNDKNAKDMLFQLLKISDKVIFTKFQIKADIGIISSYDPKELLTFAKIIRQQRYTSRHTKVVKELSVAGNAEKVLEEAIKSAKPDDLILITGSLYLVGELKKLQINKLTNDK